MKIQVLTLTCCVAFGIAAKAADKTQAKAGSAKPAEEAARQPAGERADDKKVLRKLADDFATAFNAGDAKAIAAQFAPQGEMVDFDGNVVQGRDAIEGFYAEKLKAPRFQVAVQVESLRFVGDNLVIEDGHLTFSGKDEQVVLRSRYAAVHARDGGKWLIVSSRDVVNPSDRVPPHEHLQQLAWLAGDWVEESGDSLVAASCGWDESKNFLVSEYTVKVAGQTTMSGAQRIGWDPLTRQIKTWTFDSDGGYGEGYWHRDGDRWLVKLTGVAADGRAGSATQIHTRKNDHTRTWSAVDRLLGGERLPDIEEITVVRAAPKPKQSAAKNAG
jgi:uncharacterized protein (TIGR02246 family)